MDHVHMWAPSSAHNVRCLDTNKALKTYMAIRFAAEGMSILVFREGKVSDTFLKPGNKISEVFSMDKKNQLDVTFCILYFSSNSCSTCFGATMCPSSGADDCVML